MPFFLLAGAGILSSVIGAAGASSAAGTEANAANQSTAVQQEMFDQTRQTLQPFVTSGANSLASLTGGVGTPGAPGPLSAPAPAWNPTTAGLEQTPGYQFQMSQGLQALLDAKTATGGVGGGNTLKAITSFGQGLAGNEYQQAFSNYLQQAQLQQSQQQQQFGQLYDIANLGENAAAGTGSIAAQVGSNIGNNITGAGNAAAAGQVGAANAVSGGISNLTSNYLLSSLLGNGGPGLGSLFGGGGGSGITQLPTGYVGAT